MYSNVYVLPSGMTLGRQMERLMLIAPRQAMEKSSKKFFLTRAELPTASALSSTAIGNCAELEIGGAGVAHQVVLAEKTEKKVGTQKGRY